MLIDLIDLVVVAALAAPVPPPPPLPAPIDAPAGGVAAVRDTIVDVRGHRLHFVVHDGEAPVTVVLEAGGMGDLTSWGTVPEAVAERTGATVVAYDRAGLGASELGPLDMTPEEEIEGLRTGLEALGVPRPLLLVAHSYGALLALDHAALHPDDVAGLVLVDPMNPRFIEATGDFIFSTVPEIGTPASRADSVMVRMVDGFRPLLERVGEVEPGLEVPIVVVTAGVGWLGPPEIQAAWRASHEAIAAAGPDRSLVVAERSDHDVPAVRPDVVVDSVARVLAKLDLP